MAVIKHNPEGLFPPYRSYSHAVEIKGDSKLLIICGLNLSKRWTNNAKPAKTIHQIEEC